MARATKDIAVRQTNDAPTSSAFNALQTAFDFFNEHLFEGKLPQAIILLHRKKSAHGYFWAERFGTKDDASKIDEIALNPTTMRGRDDKLVLSTLVHEMCHMEQQHFGKPPKSAYHNQEWAEMMKAVGLQPSVTGKPGAPETGPKVTHYIVEGGLFDTTCDLLLGTGLTLLYSERRFTAEEKTRAKQKAKIKYCCPACDAKVWGKPDMNVICGDCEEQMEEE